MSYTFRQNLVSSSKYSIKCPYTMSPIGICVHNTSNNASADAEIRYMIGNNNQVSYHFAIDEKEVVQGLPTDRNAWAAGDGGSGNGNRKYIHVEICRSTGDLETFKKCEQNAAEFIAKELKKRGWGIDKVKQHHDFANKNCPHRTRELGWQRFLNMIQAELNKLNGASQPKPQPQPSQPSQPQPQPSTSKFKVGNYNNYVVTTDDLNVRQQRNAGSARLTTIPKGTKVYVRYVMYQDNSATPKGSLWGGVSYNQKDGFINLNYVKPYVAPSGNAVKYRVRINTAVLNVRKEPNASSRIITQVRSGEVYTIVEERNGWGKLLSGKGWVKLSYTKRL